jgi:hypothetical protein
VVGMAEPTGQVSARQYRAHDQSSPLVDSGLLGKQSLLTLGAVGPLGERAQLALARSHLHAQQGRSQDEDQALRQLRWVRRSVPGMRPERHQGHDRRPHDRQSPEAASPA